MEIIIDRDALNASLSSVKRIISKRDSIPVLTHVMLDAKDGRLVVKGTDLDMVSAATIPCEVREGGSVVLPAHVLADVVKASPKGAQIGLRSIEGTPRRRQTGTTADYKPVYEDYVEPRIKVTSGPATATLSGLLPEDFPEVVASAPVWANRFAMPAQEMRRLLDATTFAISTEETRYYLNGVFLHVPAGGSVLRAVTTDGHRLARIDMSSPVGVEGMPGIIIPRLCVAELARMIGKSKSEISISVNAKNIEFRLDGATLTSKLIDGTYPDYSRVIPRDNMKRLSVEKESFVAAIKRVSTMSSERGKAIKLTLDAGRLAASVNNPDSGEIRDEIDAQWPVAQGRLEIGFNARYLLDIAGVVKGDRMEFTLGDNGSPAIIKDNADSRALFVLVPLRV